MNGGAKWQITMPEKERGREWGGVGRGQAAWQLLRQLKDTSCLQPVCYKGMKRGRGVAATCASHPHTHPRTRTHKPSYAYVCYLGKLSLRSSVSFCILCGLPRKRKHTHTLINSLIHTHTAGKTVNWLSCKSCSKRTETRTNTQRDKDKGLQMRCDYIRLMS